MVLRARLSNLFNKMVREMTILTDFGNLHISFTGQNDRFNVT